MRITTRTGESTKMSHGLISGVGQLVCYLSPAREAFPGLEQNICPGHSPECERNCLITSGHMRFEHARAVRIWRTKLLYEKPLEFGVLLVKEVDDHLAWCTKKGLLPAFRFNGTSDFNWESWPVPHLSMTIHQYLLAVRPEATVNEYTKRYGVMSRWLSGAYTANLHLTFSLHEANERLARRAIEAGGNVAIVFATRRGYPLPVSWWGRPVLDGDVDDLRWLDRQRAAELGLDLSGGFVIGLRAKGRLEQHGISSSFAVHPIEQRELERVA